jgi:hypothetical protein
MGLYPKIFGNNYSQKMSRDGRKGREDSCCLANTSDPERYFNHEISERYERGILL